MKPNIRDRKVATYCMEYIMRCVNDEYIFWNHWAYEGIADGDIDIDNPDLTAEIEGIDDFYVEDDTVFASLIDTFMHCMALARKNGGLFIDTVCAGERDVRK